MIVFRVPAHGLLLAMAVGCAPMTHDSVVTLELLRRDAASQVDSVPPPFVVGIAGQVVVQAEMGLGSSGYLLSASGTVAEGVVDLLVLARMPEEMAGATVLTRYLYRVASPPLVAGTYRVRLRHGVDRAEEASVVLDTVVTVGPGGN